MLLVLGLGYWAPRYFRCLCYRNEGNAAVKRATVSFWRLFTYSLFLIYVSSCHTYVTVTIIDCRRLGCIVSGSHFPSLLQPGLSSTVLRHFVCQEIEGVNFLLVDMRIRCYTSDWYQYAFASVPLILLYPIGTFLNNPLYFLLLISCSCTRYSCVLFRASTPETPEILGQGYRQG